MSKPDWDSVEDALENAKGIAWDTCHKIYVLMDDEQMELMREYEYDPLITSDEMSESEMLNTLQTWYAHSCGLRFINSVTSDKNIGDDGFVHLVPQGLETDEDEDDEDNA